MGPIPHHYKPLGKVFFPLLLLMLFPNIARAEAPLPPLNLALRYDAYVAGIPIGRIRITIAESPTRYALTIDTKSTGLVHLIAPVYSVVETTGQRIPPHEDTPTQYLPTRYHSYETRSDGTVKQETTLTFDEAGKIATRTREPEDTARWRPRLSFEEINTGSDPITAFFRIRTMLNEQDTPIAQDPFSTGATARSYDGARLAAVTLTPQGFTKRSIMERETPLIDTRITRIPINGYTPKEKKKFAEGDPEMHLYFTHDEELLPVRATVELPIGTLNVVLTKKKILPTP